LEGFLFSTIKDLFGNQAKEKNRKKIINTAGDLLLYYWI
jgi:hypothetical protein